MTRFQVGVLGLGLIGSSVVRGLAESHDVQAFDPDPAVRQRAQAAGVAVVEAAADLDDTDLLVLAAPTTANPALLAEAGGRGRTGPITDLGSVKGPIEALWLQQGATVAFVGSHPMAGSHHSGFEAGSATLFLDAPWPVVVHERTDAAALVLVIEIALSLGARPIPVSANAHDETIALISHLPHVAAAAVGATITASDWQPQFHPARPRSGSRSR